jgi:hypothetical protein
MLETREHPKSSCQRKTIPTKSRKMHLHTQTKIREKSLLVTKARTKTRRI